MLLIFRNNATTTLEAVEADPANYVGQPGIYAIPWEPVNSDRNTTHYRREGEALVYDPPAETTPEPTYRDLRASAYASELPNGDQIDAICKALIALGLAPDTTAAIDTPGGWLAKRTEIKERYPKPQE